MSSRVWKDDTLHGLEVAGRISNRMPLGITHPIRAKCIVQLNQSTPPNPFSVHDYLFYVDKSTLPDAGLGLFAASTIKKGAHLLSGATHFERLSELGKPVVIDGKPFFCSTPAPINTVDFWTDYQLKTVDTESQANLKKVWAAAKKSWENDLGLLFQTNAIPLGAKHTELPNAKSHPYILASDCERKQTADNHGFICERYYDTFETIWGLMNSPECADDENVTFMCGADDPPEDPTVLVAARDIAVGEELLWYYGGNYCRLGTFD
jgi:hypothetical protein